jgi:SIR2-like domain
VTDGDAFFDAYLDEQDRVVIAGVRLQPGEVLRRHDPVAYGELLQEFEEETRSQFLTSLVGRPSPSRYEELEDLVGRDEMIPFVGAGLSVDDGFPSWSRYLRDFADEWALPPPEVEGLMAGGQLEELAERIADKAGADRLEEDVRRTFTARHPVEGPASYLPAFGIRVCITTNFDSVLEQSFTDAQKPFDLILLGRDVSMTVQAALQSYKRVLIKLHGDARQPHTRVLTREEYQAAYNADRITEDVSSGPLVDLLKEVVLNRTLCFFGCSLVSDRTLLLMKKLRAEGLLRHWHYAIMEAPRTEDLNDRERYLTERGIAAIWYPTGQYGLVKTALWLLSRKAIG